MNPLSGNQSISSRTRKKDENSLLRYITAKQIHRAFNELLRMIDVKNPEQDEPLKEYKNNISVVYNYFRATGDNQYLFIVVDAFKLWKESIETNELMKKNHLNMAVLNNSPVASASSTTPCEVENDSTQPNSMVAQETFAQEGVDQEEIERAVNLQNNEKRVINQDSQNENKRPRLTVSEDEVL